MFSCRDDVEASIFKLLIFYAQNMRNKELRERRKEGGRGRAETENVIHNDAKERKKEGLSFLPEHDSCSCRSSVG